MARREKVQLIIEIDDEGRPVIREVTGDLRRLERQTEKNEAAARGASRAAKQQATSMATFNRHAQTGVGHIQGMSAAWGTFMGILAGAGAVGTLLSITSEYEQAYFQLSKTFGDSTDFMIAKAREMAADFDFFYDFTDIAQAFVRTNDAMERYGITGTRYLELVRRAADVGAAKNLELEESITRIEAAMRGEAESAEYLGLTLNDTFMKTIAFDGALKDTWEKLSDLEKAQYRYTELMEQSVKFTGSATEAAETFSGSVKSLANVMRDRFNATLGSANGILATHIRQLRDYWAVQTQITQSELLGEQQERWLKKIEATQKQIDELEPLSWMPRVESRLQTLRQQLSLFMGSYRIVSAQLGNLPGMIQASWQKLEGLEPIPISLAVEPIEIADIPTPEVMIGDAVAQLEAVNLAIDYLRNQGHEWVADWEADAAQWQAINDTIIEGHARRMSAWDEERERMTELVEAQDIMRASVFDLVSAEGVYLQMRQAVKGAIVAAILGYESFGAALRKATAQVLAQVAAEAAVRAVLHTAMGVAALTPWGAAVYGPASAQFKAAATFAAVAVLAGAAAKVLAGGGAGGSEGRGYREERGAGVQGLTREGRAEPEPYGARWEVHITNPIGTDDWIENNLLPELRKIAKRDTEITITYD